MVSVHDLGELERWSSAHRIDPADLRRLLIAFHKKGKSRAEAIEALPEASRAAATASLRFRHLADSSRLDSQIDRATRLLFERHDSLLVESVILRPKTGRVALCVSSQVGCAAGCSFCATGAMGIARSLTADEILDQVIAANQLLSDSDERVRNIVFMGMGEPLHNEESVGIAIERLIEPRLFHHPASRLLVSTVGVPEAMVRFARRFPLVRLALSLHSADQLTRESLIPYARRVSVESLREAARAVNAAQGDRRELMIEYVMLDGVNDTDEHLSALTSWLRGLRAHINLIPYNPTDHTPKLKGTLRPRIEAFGATLRGAGYSTTIRYSLGVDIGAACGQLIRRENRDRARSRLVSRADHAGPAASSTTDQSGTIAEGDA